MIKKTVLSIVLVLLVLLSFSESLDIKSSGQLDAAFERSLTTVIQGTEVSLAPAGVGLNFAPGEIVDPINDMVERFSWVMLASSVSLGVQQVMLHLGGTVLFKTVLALITLFFLLLYWTERLRAAKLYEWSLKALLVILLLRFSIPLLVMINEGVYEYLLADSYRHSSEVVFDTSEDIKAMIKTVQSDQEKPSADVQAPWYTFESLNVNKKFDHYREKLEQTIQGFIDKFNEAMESIIRLITIFVINSILVPLATLWLFVHGIGALLRKDILV
jgi:ABC-type multidrug transport system fused ATPase/permease subunit